MLYFLGGLVIVSGLLYIIGIIRSLQGKGKVEPHRKPVDEKDPWQYHPIGGFKKHD